MLIRASALIAFCMGLVVFQAPITKDSPVKSSQEESFNVAGYSVRTNNAKEMNGQGEIGKLWQRFMQENLGAKIPGRTDATLYVVYSHYANHEKGDYTYTLGARVPSIKHLPAGMKGLKIVPGQYAVFTTDQGPTQKVVPDEWQKIWAMQPEQFGGKRAFVTDYEVYDRRSADPRNAQVDIHIGLHPTTH